MSKTYFYTIRDMFEYKSIKYNKLLLEAKDDYPSTKICSCCSKINDKIGSKKTFKCPVCGNVIDRDSNASLNLVSLYEDYLEGDFSNLDFSWRKSYV